MRFYLLRAGEQLHLWRLLDTDELRVSGKIKACTLQKSVTSSVSESPTQKAISPLPVVCPCADLLLPRKGGKWFDVENVGGRGK